jgi:hypothetical protein
LVPWSAIIEAARGIDGSRWALCALANMAAGIRSKTETSSGCDDLFDESMPLAARVRYARLRAGNPGWWMRQAKSATTKLERMLALTVVMSWGSSRTILHLLAELDGLVGTLESRDLEKVHKATKWATRVGGIELKRLQVITPLKASALTPDIIGLLALRGDSDLKTYLYDNFLRTYSGENAELIQFCMVTEQRKFAQSGGNWRRFAQLAERVYGGTRASDRVLLPTLTPLRRATPMPLTIAREITDRPDDFPFVLVTLAEQRCREDVAGSVVPVAVSAEKEGWFA